MSSVKSSGNNRARERAILDFMTELLALDRLDDILQAIVQETPKLIDSKGCSIYLAPHLVKQYKGKLIDGNGEEISADQIHQDFIILAAASLFRDLSAKVGRYFYRAGEGLTGWVFKTKQPLLLSDMDNEEELRQYDGLHWKNKYKGARHYYNMRDRSPKPFLAIPLVLGNRCYGAIRVGTSQDRRPFPNWTKGVFLSFGRVISHRIEIDTTIQEQVTSIRKQKRSIENLIKIGGISVSNKLDSFNAILEETQKVVGASTCCLYTPDRYGETVQLEATSRSDSKDRGEPLQPPPARYHRNEGLTGWIFSTGKPLLINDVASFTKKKRLKNRDLEQYSDSCWINSESRVLQAMENERLCEGNEFPHFMGVPVLTGGGWSQGVLTVRSKANEKPFTRYGLNLLTEIAANISTLLANLERQRLNEMLIRIGQEHDDRLFEYVVEKLPEMVLARGCSIFLKTAEASSFKLRYTNSTNLMEDPWTRKLSTVEYQPGIGKTGFVAKLGRTLVINHYGTSKPDRRKLHKDYKKYTKDERFQDMNMVGILKDEKSREVGLARLVRTSNDEPEFTRPEREAFKQFLHGTAFGKEGLSPNVETKLCEEGGGGFTKSFLACPLRDRQGNIFGVLRIPRTFPGGVFTDEALEVTASVCNRLSAVIEKKRIQEQNERVLKQNVKILSQNLKILSEINTQINSSFASKARDPILKSILEAVTHTLDFEFASIQLVDPNQNTIYTKTGMKNKNIPDAPDPTKWIADAQHPLDPPKGQQRDIHAWLLREHRNEKIIKGWDPHFDPEIYEKYGHKDLIRAFIPIVMKEPYEAIGTIEAGYRINRKSDIDDKEIAMLKALADQAALAIRNHALQQELIKAELMQLVPYMAHVLKRPAVDLMLILEQMRHELDKDNPNLEQLREYTKMASRTSLTAYSMSRTLAEEVKQRTEIQQVKSVDLIEIIKRPISALQPDGVSVGYAHQVRIEPSLALMGKQILLTELECTWVEIVLLNILINAIKVSPRGGAIKVECFEDKTEGIIIGISDQGPGIPSDISYDPGPKPQVDGWPQTAGLGLYTVKRLTGKMGWKCTVANTSEGGARFEVCIPKEWRTNQ